MLDKLRDFFLKEFQLSHISQISSGLMDVLYLLDQEYLKEKDSKNAVIDTVCQILQQYKDNEEGVKKNA